MLAHTLGVTSKHEAWSRLLRQGEAFRRAQVRILAATVGGGMCGPAPAACVASAALALAGSRLAYQGGDLKLGARLAIEVRQHLLAAHELCAREAMARPDPDADEADERRAAFQRRLLELQAPVAVAAASTPTAAKPSAASASTRAVRPVLPRGRGEDDPFEHDDQDDEEP